MYIEELVEQTGYTLNTIRTMVVEGVITSAVRGTAKTNFRGVYAEDALERILFYKAALGKGLKRREAINHVRERFK